MSKRSLVAIIMMMCMSLSLLVGCGGEEAVNEEVSSEVSSVTEDVNSEVNVSEEVSASGSEENEEAVSEEESSEVIEEVDYSADAVMGLIDELIAKYPDENADYIKALVIAMNLDYMSREDVEAVMSTYGYSFEQLNANFVGILEVKRDIFYVRSRYMADKIDEYENRYENSIMIYECCLNPDETTYFKNFEDTVAYSDISETTAYVVRIAENYDGSKKHYIIAMIGIGPDYRANNIPGFDAYSNVVSEYANAL